MTPEQFCYWFQGFCELSPCPPNDAQWQSIRDHLQTVFKKVTPTISDEALRRMFSGPLITPQPLSPDTWQKPPTITC